MGFAAANFCLQPGGAMREMLRLLRQSSGHSGKT